MPPFTVTPAILSLVAAISELVGRLETALPPERQLLLRRNNRLRTIHGTLAIEGNTLSLEQVTAVVAGKRVLGTPREVQEVRGAIAVYERLPCWQPGKVADLLTAHRLLMTGLVDRSGTFRRGAAGTQRGKAIVHVAPPAGRVQALIGDLLAWLRTSTDHPLITACVFHDKFEFIHPFADGNGRMGRLWQTLILSRWKPLFALVPVESLIRDQQAGYHAALDAASQAGEPTPFIAFMLAVIRDALAELVRGSDQVSDLVSDQVAALLSALGTQTLSATELMRRLDLKHRPSFRQRYLQPALDAKLIEMTRPDAPRSSVQRYRRASSPRRTRQAVAIR